MMAVNVALREQVNSSPYVASSEPGALPLLLPREYCTRLGLWSLRLEEKFVRYDRFSLQTCSVCFGLSCNEVQNKRRPSVHPDQHQHQRVVIMNFGNTDTWLKIVDMSNFMPQPVIILLGVICTRTPPRTSASRHPQPLE
jgi:hypothetical protein